MINLKSLILEAVESFVKEIKIPKELRRTNIDIQTAYRYSAAFKDQSVFEKNILIDIDDNIFNINDEQDIDKLIKKNFIFKKELFTIKKNLNREIKKYKKTLSTYEKTTGVDVWKEFRGLSRDDLIDYFSIGLTLKEINQRLRSVESIDMSVEELKDFRHRYRTIIEERSEKMSKLLNSRHLATESGRVDELCFIYESFRENFIDSDNIREKNAIGRSMIETLKELREEMKGHIIHLKHDMTLEIQMAEESSIALNRAAQKIPLSILAISMAAVKNKTNPLELVQMLMNSIYSSYTEIDNSKPFEGYPSEKISDINWIDVLKEAKIDKNNIPLPVENTNKSTAIKLLQKLKQDGSD